MPADGQTEFKLAEALVEVGWSSAGGESSSERWREVGVPAATLRRTGITRGR